MWHWPKTTSSSHGTSTFAPATCCVTIEPHIHAPVHTVPMPSHSKYQCYCLRCGLNRQALSRNIYALSAAPIDHTIDCDPRALWALASAMTLSWKGSLMIYVACRKLPAGAGRRASTSISSYLVYVLYCGLNYTVPMLFMYNNVFLALRRNEVTKRVVESTWCRRSVTTSEIVTALPTFWTANMIPPCSLLLAACKYGDTGNANHMTTAAGSISMQSSQVCNACEWAVGFCIISNEIRNPCQKVMNTTDFTAKNFNNGLYGRRRSRVPAQKWINPSKAAA